MALEDSIILPLDMPVVLLPEDTSELGDVLLEEPPGVCEEREEPLIPPSRIEEEPLLPVPEDMPPPMVEPPLV
jgi:hypothetical protein